jgi:DeoR family fructose operon transcriptional repressor
MVDSSVDAEVRRTAITRSVSPGQPLRIDELAELFAVSSMTIRRDLQELEARGILRRVRGGAVLRGPESFTERSRQASRAKERIATKLMTLLPRSGAIGLDASSTIHRLATHIDGEAELTVVTYGPETFQILRTKPGVRAYLTGGEQDSRTGALGGPIACLTIRQFMFSRVFLSASLLDPALGSSDDTIEEAEVKRVMADMAQHVVLAVDSSKLGGRTTARTLPLERIDLLVTELDPSHELLTPYRGHAELL